MNNIQRAFKDKAKLGGLRQCMAEGGIVQPVAQQPQLTPLQSEAVQALRTNADMLSLGGTSPLPGTGAGAQHNWLVQSNTETAQPYSLRSVSMNARPTARGFGSNLGAEQVAKQNAQKRPPPNMMAPLEMAEGGIVPPPPKPIVTSGIRGLTNAVGYADGGVVESPEQLMARMAAKYGTTSEPPATVAAQPVAVAPAPQPVAPAQKPGLGARLLNMVPGVGIIQQRQHQMENMKTGGIVEDGTTPTADDVPVNLSRGEAVLPHKTVQAMGGPEAVEELIEKTNGKPPVSKGLRAGGNYAGGLGGFTYDQNGKVLGVPEVPGQKMLPPPTSTSTAVVPVSQPVAQAAPSGRLTPEQIAANGGLNPQPRVQPTATQPVSRLKTLANGAGALGKALDVGNVAYSTVKAGRNPITFDDLNDEGGNRIVGAAKALPVAAGDIATTFMDGMYALPYKAANKLGLMSDERYKAMDGAWNKTYRDGLRGNLRGVNVPETTAHEGSLFTNDEPPAQAVAAEPSVPVNAAVVDKQIEDAQAASQAAQRAVLTSTLRKAEGFSDKVSDKTYEASKGLRGLREAAPGVLAGRDANGRLNVTSINADTPEAMKARGDADAQRIKDQLATFQRMNAESDIKSNDPRAQQQGREMLASLNQQQAAATAAANHKDEIGLRKAMIDEHTADRNERSRQFKEALKLQAAAGEKKEAEDRFAHANSLLKSTDLPESEHNAFLNYINENHVGGERQADGSFKKRPGEDFETLTKAQQQKMMPGLLAEYNRWKVANENTLNGKSRAAFIPDAERTKKAPTLQWDDMAMNQDGFTAGLPKWSSDDKTDVTLPQYLGRKFLPDGFVGSDDVVTSTDGRRVLRSKLTKSFYDKNGNLISGSMDERANLRNAVGAK